MNKVRMMKIGSFVFCDMLFCSHIFARITHYLLASASDRFGTHLPHKDTGNGGQSANTQRNQQVGHDPVSAKAIRLRSILSVRTREVISPVLLGSFDQGLLDLRQVHDEQESGKTTTNGE